MPPRLIPPLSSAFRSFTRPIPYTCKTPQPLHRAASQFRGFPGGYRRSSYNRFDRAQRLADRWKTSPNFRLGVAAAGGGGLGFYIYNSETIPISGRRRFNCVPESWELNYAKGSYRDVMASYGKRILPPDHPDSIVVNRVLQRLIPASGLGAEDWEVRVIGDREQKNAFVLPGGKVFVFSGILPICKDEDGLAAVLGHEIAHNVAHHTGEKMSKYAVILAAIWISSYIFSSLDPQYFSVLLDYMVSRPGSRAMETEADQIGLLMMARSCYDPQKAVGFWERMKKAEEYAPPQWASTHPSSQNRILAIQNWIPQAQEQRASSGCSGMSGYADDFARAYQQDRAPPRRPMIAQQQPGRRDDDDDYFF